MSYIGHSHFVERMRCCLTNEEYFKALDYILEKAEIVQKGKGNWKKTQEFLEFIEKYQGDYILFANDWIPDENIRKKYISGKRISRIPYKFIEWLLDCLSGNEQQDLFTRLEKHFRVPIRSDDNSLGKKEFMDLIESYDEDFERFANDWIPDKTVRAKYIRYCQRKRLEDVLN